MSHPTLLSQIRAVTIVDVDSMNPDVAARHTSPSASFCDMTSNQAIVYGEAVRPERSHVFKSALESVKAKGIDDNSENTVQDVVDVLNVLLAKEVYPYLTGKVHVQTSPSTAYDTEKTIAHAKRLVSLFEGNGIPKDRVCIKIPATPESLIACQYLEKSGIHTLATCLFSVPQAVAASQAGCLYVAPYFNELRVHFEPTLWREYQNTAVEHPMSSVIYSIIRVFKKIDSKTLVLPASIVTAAEVIALTSLHPDHLTLSGGVLDQIALLPEVTPEQLETPTPVSDKYKLSESVVTTDYLAGGAEELRNALQSDVEATRKLRDALKIFDEMELKTKELVRKELAKI